MTNVSVYVSGEDQGTLLQIEARRGVPGEKILAAVVHDFLHEQSRTMACGRAGVGIAGLGEFAPEAEVAAMFGEVETRFVRARGGLG